MKLTKFRTGLLFKVSPFEAKFEHCGDGDGNQVFIQLVVGLLNF